MQLLGKDSNDLDVAVSTMMGYDFAVHVNEYLTSKGYETRSIAKIDSNPDKSKHLETATTKLFDQEVDFVNLRNEVYNEDSRIPAQVVSLVVTMLAIEIVWIIKKGSSSDHLLYRRMEAHLKMPIDEISLSIRYFSTSIRYKSKILLSR
jgi:hypothetical protein